MLGKSWLLYNLPADWARELFKPTKDVASLLVCIEKNCKVLDLGFFVGDVIGGIGLDTFGRGHRALIPNRKSQFLTQVFIGN